MSAATKAPILMDDQRPDRSRRKGMLQARSSHGEDICGRDNTRSNDGRAPTIADHDLKNTGIRSCATYTAAPDRLTRSISAPIAMAMKCRKGARMRNFIAQTLVIVGGRTAGDG